RAASVRGWTHSARRSGVSTACQNNQELPRKLRATPEARSMANLVCSPTRVLRSAHQLFVALIAICGFATVASAQTTVTLSEPGKHIYADLTIQGGAYGWVDYSSDDVIASKVSSESYTRRMMFKFDTQNFIPANAVIQSA